MAGTWKSSQYWGGWQEGIVDLSPITDLVPAEIKTEAETLAECLQERATDDLHRSSPARSTTVPGPTRCRLRHRMTGEELLSMTWFVEGVDGEIPNSAARWRTCCAPGWLPAPTRVLCWARF